MKFIYTSGSFNLESVKAFILQNCSQIFVADQEEVKRQVPQGYLVRERN